MRARSLGAWGALVAIVVVASCGADRQDTSSTSVEPPLSTTGLAPSVETHDSVEALRQRFRIKPLARRGGTRSASVAAPTPFSVIGRGVATGFEPSSAERVHAVIPLEAKHHVLRAASVELPMHANAMVRLEDDTTHVSVGFALRDANEASIAVADGIAMYAGALHGADVVHRVHAEGTEDFVVFEERPAKEEIAYDVDVSHTAGLRLVSNTLELLDETGAPRLRVASPYVVDARGLRTEAKLAVEGCAYDTDPSGPWGRAITKAGASHCTLRVGWSGVSYPLIVDPSWVATGSMAVARSSHAMVLLASGHVLVAGGADNSDTSLQTAELFNEAAGSFAVTGTMTHPRQSLSATLLSTNKVLIAGGSDDVGILQTAELFDGVGTFSGLGTMPYNCSGHTATLLSPSSMVLLAGGTSTNSAQDASGATASVQIFDGVATFTEYGMWKARNFHTATLLASGKVLLAGGSNAGGYTATAEIFDPATLQSTLVGSMTVARAAHTATRLPSGKVLIAGGITPGGPPPGGLYVATAELFDGISTFAATGSMTTGCALHTATLLPSGSVLTAGGENAVNLGLAVADLFNGISIFAATGSLTTGRSGHTAVLLPSGKVLVAGGASMGVAAMTSAELYNLPAGATCTVANDCQSGVCNGKCCTGACAGTCMTCDGTGACLQVKSAPDPDTCSVALNESSCDANGVCKKVQGQACALDSDCDSAFCADGFCCNTACGSACDVCAKSLGASVDGTCGPAPVGNPGNPACGNGVACDGSSATCPATCVSDIDCLAADYCSAAGACAPRKAQGVMCNQAAGADCLGAGCRDCASGNCADGVCCDTACTGNCMACSAALKGQGSDGTCGNALADSNPHNQCTASAGFPDDCAADGNCDGSGACRLFAHNSVACGATVCTNGSVSGKLCNGTGSCADSAPVDCGLYPCNGNACAQSCADDSGCDSATAYCTAANTCAAREAFAAACTKDDQCPIGGFCVDGVCCNSTCAGECQACDVVGHPGTCFPVTGKPHGMRTPCTTADATCGGTCDGTNAAVCTYPSSTTACGTSCASGQETNSTCNGSGKCEPGMANACPGNIVACEGSTKCKSTCTADTDCAKGFGCTTGQCVPVTGGVCAGSIITDGTKKTDCSPFNCESGGTCRTTCASVDDCVAPNVCSAAQQCVAPAPTQSNSGESGGCAIATAPRESSPLRAAFLLALGLGLVARRRRRHERPPITSR